MRRLLLRLLRIELVLVYLVIVAGSVVRMSGSGMGCPDWPKCFGLLIPPTQHEQVAFHPQSDYKKGQMIVVNDTLWVAQTDIHTAGEWNRSNWSAYTKHDYTLFNPVHTWIEYINRLLGALAGIPMLLIFIASLYYLRKFTIITLIGASGLFMLGFVAWLGKLVVDGHLIPGQITLHMLGAMIIIALLFTMMALLQQNVKKYLLDSKPLKTLLSIALVLTIVQIIMGTQVREQVDELYKQFDGGNRGAWLGELDITFYIHRSFSIALLAVNGFLWQRNRKADEPVKLISVIMLLLMLELFTGIALVYVDFPPAAQPMHLVLAIVIFGLQYFLWFHNQLARVKDPESETFIARRGLMNSTPSFQSSMNQHKES